MHCHLVSQPRCADCSIHTAPDVHLPIKIEILKKRIYSHRKYKRQMRETRCTYAIRTANASRTWVWTGLCHDMCENVMRQQQHRSVKLPTTWVRATSVVFLGSVRLGQDVFYGEHSRDVVNETSRYASRRTTPFRLNTKNTSCVNQSRIDSVIGCSSKCCSRYV